MLSRGTALLWGWLGLVAAGALAADACPEGERCRDDRLAKALADRLSRSERVFVAAAQGHTTRAYAVAANELVWDRVRALPEASAALRGIAAQQLIDAYLLVGFSEQALALYRSLDPELQQRVTTGSIVFGSSSEDWRDFDVEASPQLTAAGLALACAEAGQPECAKTLLQRAALPVRSGSKQSYAGDTPAPSRVAAACLRSLIEAGASFDAFAWRFGIDAAGEPGLGCVGAVPSRAYDRRVAELLAQSGLPESWRVGVEPNDQPGTINSEQERLDAALAKLPQAHARVAQLRRELAEIDRGDERWIELGKRLEQRERSSTPVASTATRSERDAALVKTLLDRLTSEVINPYQIVPAGPGERGDRSAKRRAAVDPNCGKAELRCIDLDEVHWSLEVSTDYDPTGEVPAAGFWLRRSEREHQSQQRYYLGLKEHLPFELADSTEPWIVGDQLRLRMRRAALDPNSITFPPIGLEFASGDLVELRASLDAIRSDRDQDGLSDLAEQQLLLDPGRADSDDDGSVDGMDSLPNVAQGVPVSPRQQAFAAAISYLWSGEDAGISFGVPGSAAFGRRRATGERTLFLVADPENVSGLVSDTRIVVLPLGLDLGQLRKHSAFAVFYPMQVSLQMFGDGRHAEVSFDADWRGGTLALEWRDGRWRTGVLRFWIS